MRTITMRVRAVDFAERIAAMRIWLDEHRFEPSRFKYSEDGNDVLIGGPNDTLTGGAGIDTFVFNLNFGKETNADYNVNEDVLAFDHRLFSSDTASQVLSQAHDSKAGVVIVVDPSDTITLAGVTVAQLQAAGQAHVDWLHFF